MKFRKSAYSIYKTEYYIVLISQYWWKEFIKGVKGYKEKLICHLQELNPDIEVFKVNVQEDHVHIGLILYFDKSRSGEISFRKLKQMQEAQNEVS